MTSTSSWNAFEQTSDAVLANRVALAASRVAAGKSLSNRQQETLLGLLSVLRRHKEYSERGHSEQISWIDQTITIVESSVAGLATKNESDSRDIDGQFKTKVGELIEQLEMLLSPAPNRVAAEEMAAQYLLISSKVCDAAIAPSTVLAHNLARL